MRYIHDEIDNFKCIVTIQGACVKDASVWGRFVIRMVRTHSIKSQVAYRGGTSCAIGTGKSCLKIVSRVTGFFK